MKICFLADANSVHTKKIAQYLNKQGYELFVISLNYGEIENVKVYNLACQVNDEVSGFGKLSYIKKIKSIKRILQEEKPDVVHAHYATSYGLLGVLSRSKPLFISAWGSDIYIYPRKSFIHKAVLKFNLKHADRLFSTSKSMAKEMSLYTNRNIIITPFGIDLEEFSVNDPIEEKGKINIGLAKGLEEVYGIDTLIKAFSNVVRMNQDKDIKLKLAGKGSKLEELIQLTKRLGVKDSVEFCGFLNKEQLKSFYKDLDLVVVPSRSESFGVVALEAQACGIPVIVSNTPGLTEVTIEGETSLVFQIDDVEELTKKINELIKDPLKRKVMGNNGREFVCENYEYESNLKKIVDEYEVYK